MKNFVKNNLTNIFNLVLIVLLFTYPITNITGLENKKAETTKSEPFKISNSGIENSSDINLKKYNKYSVKPITNSEPIFQTHIIFFTKK